MREYLTERDWLWENAPDPYQHDVTLWLDVTEFTGAVPHGLESDGSGQCVGVPVDATVNEDDEVVSWDSPHWSFLEAWCREHKKNLDALIVEEVRRS